MLYQCDLSYIPGTVLSLSDYGNETGNAFLKRIFYLNDTVMLNQVRAISGVDTSTLQNWVKRGWLMNTVNRRYSREHLSRILIINMLRPVMQLEEIDRLLHYVNGEADTTEDDIITEAGFYDLICQCILVVSALPEVNEANEKAAVHEILQGEKAMIPSTRSRLQKALNVILPAYFASLMLISVKENYRLVVQDASDGQTEAE